MNPLNGAFQRTLKDIWDKKERQSSVVKITSHAQKVLSSRNDRLPAQSFNQYESFELKSARHSVDQL